VSAAVHGDGLTSLQFRRATGDTTGQIQSPIKGANVIQLERRGDVYIMSVAKYGDTLSTVQTTNVPLGDDVYVGLFVCAHNDTVTERATLSDVRITVPAKATFVPYRDYIGSNVEILEVATGRRRIIHHADNSIQAPNWTRDGKALIYNQGGKLYRFDLATSTPTEINTGERIRPATSFGSSGIACSTAPTSVAAATARSTAASCPGLVETISIPDSRSQTSSPRDSENDRTAGTIRSAARASRSARSCPSCGRRSASAAQYPCRKPPFLPLGPAPHTSASSNTISSAGSRSFSASAAQSPV